MDELLRVFRYVRENNPLIHCITNHININDSANIILAGNGQPIMAEHPDEVYEITKGSNSLMLNFGNINSERYKSSIIAYKSAMENKIPILIDLVGCGCSGLRRKLYRELQKIGSPSIIKGNMSEIISIHKDRTISNGVDSKKEHKLEIDLIKTLAIEHNTVIIATGEKDVITNGIDTYICENGHYLMSRRTGTGCVGSSITTMYLSSNDTLNSAILGTVIMGIIGERASNTVMEETTKLGYLFIEMINELYNLTEDDIIQDNKIYRI